MSKFKIGLYAVLIPIFIWSAWGFHQAKKSADLNTDREARFEQSSSTETTKSVPDPAILPDTNVIPSATNLASTNSAIAAAPAAAKPVKKPEVAGNESKGSYGSVVGYLAMVVITLIILGVSIGYDVARFVGARSAEILTQQGEEAEPDVDYDKAEETWANGQPLQAIQMMRDYLKKNPREQHVALRIAEIYEKDLQNNVAAILEYEEVLKQKLPAEKWGWAAIHLCNLYNKMDKPAKAVALLTRINVEYPQTSAARKARKHLGLPEDLEESEMVTATQEQDAASEVVETPATETQPPAEPEPPAANLPPGFRPK